MPREYLFLHAGIVSSSFALLLHLIGHSQSGLRGELAVRENDEGEGGTREFRNSAWGIVICFRVGRFCADLLAAGSASGSGCWIVSYCEP
jgi:hypothetical protein